MSQSQSPSGAALRDQVRRARVQLERKALILNAVSLLALVFVVIAAAGILLVPGVGNERIAVLALAVAMVAFLVPTAEAHRRNAIEAADALDRLSGVRDDADWLQIERRIPRLLPRLWPRDDATSPRKADDRDATN